MNNDLSFLNLSEIKYFSNLYDDFGGDDNGICYSSLKEIILSYDRFSKQITITSLNSFLKRLKENQISRISDSELIVCNQHFI